MPAPMTTTFFMVVHLSLFHSLISSSSLHEEEGMLNIAEKTKSSSNSLEELLAINLLLEF
ncbi:hypothetical protein [Bacillus sp. THAF10]|uniref:hypothetical protein n=1 Tax=Bacillus sp. THAF10 TaxID=2587848 RepID=UPI001268B426|nr:hypothetical protein [Bacillus sp. THAF10]